MAHDDDRNGDGGMIRLGKSAKNAIQESKVYLTHLLVPSKILDGVKII